MRKWGPTIRLGDGSLWRSDNALDPADTLPRSITGQHPLVVAAGGTITPASGLQSWPGSNGARLSADRYGLVRFANTGPLLPVTVTREHYSYNGRVAPGAGPYCLKETAQSGDNRMFPAIIDRGFVYTLEPETASSWPSIVNLRVSDLDDGSDPMDGDLVILCFKGFSSFSPRVDRIGNGATSVPDYGGIPTASYSENEVKYHWDPATGDLWLAIVGPGDPNLNEVNLHLRP